MSIFEASRSPWTERMLSIFRIVAGLIFFSAGTMKMFGYPHMPGLPPFHLLSEIGLAASLEVFGGGLVTLGLLTRPLSFILSGEMAVAYFQAHAPQSFFPMVNMGVPAVMYCFFFLYLVFAGGGSWSVDAVIARSRRASREPSGAQETAPSAG